MQIDVQKEGRDIRDAMYNFRLVAKGYNKILGVGFTYVFSLVVKNGSIRALLGVVVKNNLEFEQTIFA